MTGNCPVSPVDLYDVTSTVAGTATTYTSIYAKSGSRAVTSKRIELDRSKQYPRHSLWSVAPVQEYVQTGATHFDGVSDYYRRTSDFVGTVNGNKGTICGWTKPTSANASNTILANVGGWLEIDASCFSGLFYPAVYAYDTAGNWVMGISFGSSIPFVANVWVSWGLSWDMTNGLFTGFVNGASQTVSLDQYSYQGLPLKYASLEGDKGWLSHASIYAPPNVVNKTGQNCVAEVWMDLTRYVDFSALANIRKFVTSANTSVNLGSTGERPFGVQPIFYSPKMDGVNLGTGGNLAAVGAPSVCSTHP